MGLDKGLLDPWPEQTHFVVLSPSGTSRRVDWPYERDAFSALFWLEPETCLPGQFLLDDACFPCPKGTFLPEPGALELSRCEPCPAGTYAQDPGSTTCTACPPGSFSPLPGQSQCDLCPAGSFNPSSSAPECRPCPRGSFSSTPGQTLCSLCRPNQAQPDLGQTACLECNATSQYSGEGDARCLPCGTTPDLDQVECPITTGPPPDRLAWVQVRGLGQEEDECLARADSTLDDVRVLRLRKSARCKHVLRGAGQGVLSVWEEPAPARIASSIQVIQHNDTFYPAWCEAGKGFQVLLALRDEDGILLQPEEGPVNSQAFMRILDPTGAHQLAPETACSLLDRACHTAFCPTMDVLVRARLEQPGEPDIEGSARLSAGLAVPCPPVSAWTVGLHLELPGRPFMPDDTLTVAVRVHNGIPAQAYRLVARVGQAFALESFTPKAPGELASDKDGRVTFQGDLSTSSGALVLGTLTLRHARNLLGIAPALHVEQAAFMIQQGQWLPVPVQAHGFVCRHDGVLVALADAPRITALIATAQRSTLVLWRALQDNALVFPGRVEAYAVYSTGGSFVQARDLACASKGAVVVDSCQRIVPVAGREQACVTVVQEQAKTVFCFRVLVPSPERIVHLPVSRPGRILVEASLDGAVVDATRMLNLPRALEGDEIASCTETILLGEPVALACRHEPSLDDPSWLLAGAWTSSGSFQVAPGALTPAIPFAYLLGTTEPNADPTRARWDGRGLHLVRSGATPACVGLGSLSFPIIPPAPKALRVELTATVLAAQQDPWRVLPTRARVSSASLLFSDGVAVDVSRDARLALSVDHGILRAEDSWGIRSSVKPGTATVLALYEGIPCVRAIIPVRVVEKSVVRTTLECAGCPRELSTPSDPLAQAFPDRFPASIPVSALVIQHELADGTLSRAQDEPLELGEGGFFLDETRLGSLVPSSLLTVTASRARLSLTFPVVERWAVACRLLCNAVPCEQLAGLAPPDDPASVHPFNYPSRVALSFELTLANGSRAELPWLPQATIRLDGEALGALEFSLDRPGLHTLQADFGAGWRLAQPHATVQLAVHSLESIRLQGPVALYQLHCTRTWEEARLQLVGRLSDGREEILPLSQASWLDCGGVIEVDAAGSVVRAKRQGEGWVRAALGGQNASLVIRAMLESHLFTSVDFSLPACWVGKQGSVLDLQPVLQPAIQPPPKTLARVLRWVASEPGAVEFPGPTSIRLLSDFYGAITVSGIVRGCQGADPVVVSKAVGVNLAPGQTGQIDFGSELACPPLPHADAGLSLEVPLFLFSSAPLLEFDGWAALPGLRLEPACQPGDLPFSACEVTNASHIRMRGNFPHSQRAGRIRVGTLRGEVQLDAVSRLRVGMRSLSRDGQEANSTHEFAVQLGRGARGAVQTGLNRVRLHSEPGPLIAWDSPPDAFEACCHQLVAAPDSSLAGLFPVSFRLNLTVAGQEIQLDDPRVQAFLDDELLRVDPDTGQWSVRPGARGVTSITLRYVQPGTLRAKDVTLRVVFAEARGLELEPPTVELRRIHCSSAFEFQAVRAFVRVGHGGRAFPLRQGQLHVEDTVIASADGFVVKGVRPGVTRTILRAFGLEAGARVIVLDASMPLTRLILPDPYVLSPQLGDEPLRLAGVLASGQEIADIVPLVAPEATIQQEDLAAVVLPNPLRLHAVANTHPNATYTLHARVRACGKNPALLASARLVVRLSPHPYDLVVRPGGGAFDLLLAAAEPVRSLILRVQTDAGNLLRWIPGPGSPPLADLALHLPMPGSLVLAGVFPSPGAQTGPIATLEPMPRSLQGHLEVHTESGRTVRAPILAGRYGTHLAEPPEHPTSVIDAGGLARAYFAGRDDLQTLLQLATGTGRLVEPVLYANDREVSAMARVLDRYLEPDTQSKITVVFENDQLPALLGLDSASVSAQHQMDGWHAAQFLVRDPLPRLSVPVRFELEGRTVANGTLQTGDGLPACPRYAANRAILEVVYRLDKQVGPEFQRALACAVHVAPRRVDVQNGQALIRVESFIRMQQAHEAIGMNSTRILDFATVMDRVVHRFINDTADPPAECPMGRYFSRNGTYERLPLHSVAGIDCYEFKCLPGYVRINEHECAPETVPLDVVWACLIVLSGIIGVCACVILALYWSRARHQDPVQLAPPSQQEPPDDNIFLTDDPRVFRRVAEGLYMDDYTAAFLDDDLRASCIPLGREDSEVFKQPLPVVFPAREADTSPP